MRLPLSYRASRNSQNSLGYCLICASTTKKNLHTNITDRGLSKLSLHNDKPSASLGNLNPWKAFPNLDSMYSRIPK